MKIIATRVYERRVKKLLPPSMRASVETSLAVAPDAWPVVRGTKGARKARISLPGRGKSGGARVIYYWRSRAGELYLLTIYAKNEQEDLSHADIQAIRALIDAIEEEPVDDDATRT